MYKKIEQLLVLLVVLINMSEATKPDNPYCTISRCDPGTHTLCRFDHLEPSESCYNITKTGLEQYEREQIVELHNDLRRYVYNGSEHRGNSGPLPKSRYEKLLEWDDELAEIAQRWSEQCKIGHDRCRHVVRFLVGQNYGYQAIHGNPNAFSVKSIIMKWYNEVSRFRVSNIYSFDRPLVEMEKCAQFSQIIWHFTYRIGCGAMRYIVGDVGTLLLVCNYGPKGNYHEKPMYPVYNGPN